MANAGKVTNWIWGLVSALLLVVVAAHAVAPLEPELGQSRGSAFSASTQEVSLKSGVRALVATDIVRVDPLTPPFVVVSLALAVADRPVQRAPAALLDIRPGLAKAALTPISPRAPPAA